MYASLLNISNTVINYKATKFLLIKKLFLENWGFQNHYCHAHSRWQWIILEKSTDSWEVGKTLHWFTHNFLTMYHRSHYAVQCWALVIILLWNPNPKLLWYLFLYYFLIFSKCIVLLIIASCYILCAPHFI